MPYWPKVYRTGVVAIEICPRGPGPTGRDCRSKAPGYKSCMKRYRLKNAAGLCQQALIVRLECSAGERAMFHNRRDCDWSANTYLSCRTESPKRSNDVCAEAVKQSLRCPGFSMDPTTTFDCMQVLDAYYKCRDTGPDSADICDVYIELLSDCTNLRVDCSDLLDKTIACGIRDQFSPNECAFSLTRRTQCLRAMSDGIFHNIATCDSILSNTIKRCRGLDTLKSENSNTCTQGENWEDKSYSICEVQGPPARTVSIYYIDISERDPVQQPPC